MMGPLHHQMKVEEIISQSSPLGGATDRDKVLLMGPTKQELPPPPNLHLMTEAFPASEALYTVNRTCHKPFRDN
jgi:hypothetical protein